MTPTTAADLADRRNPRAAQMMHLGVRFVTAGSEWDFMLQAARQRANLLAQLPLE